MPSSSSLSLASSSSNSKLQLPTPNSQLMAINCPSNSFVFNSTLCSCNPGFYLTPSSSTCANFDAPEGNFVAVNVGVDPAGPALLSSVLPLDALRRLTEPQEELIGAALVGVVVWLVFCLVVRAKGKLDGGDSSIWFKLRWWISRMDSCFNTKHWVEDRKVLRKRKTELGGTFSVASWILFVGLLSALLYQVITRRTIEIHRVRPANAPDLLSFVNDMEFSITTVSSMSCSHLRAPGQIVIGSPGSIYYKVLPLSSYMNYTCYNTSRGPTVSLKCNNCKVPLGDHYISWQFVDLPGDPASAVGFEFNLTAKATSDDKHLSFVSGTLKSSDGPQTFRGQDMNIVKIHLFPQKFNYLHDLRLIQPLLHDFRPGSSFSEVSNLRASLENSKDGLVNTTLYVSYLSDYIVEIDKQKIVGIVSFLANVGGLYTISLAIFLYLLVQCEVRFKTFRVEDTVMRDIRSQKRAQRNWEKVRKYVNYTWGHSNLNVKNLSSKRHDGLLVDSFCGIGSMHKIKHPSRRSASSTRNFGGSFSSPSEVKHVVDDIKKDGESREIILATP